MLNKLNNLISTVSKFLSAAKRALAQILEMLTLLEQGFNRGFGK